MVTWQHSIIVQERKLFLKRDDKVVTSVHGYRTLGARARLGWRSEIGRRQCQSKRMQRRTAAPHTERQNSLMFHHNASWTSASMCGPWDACCTSSCMASLLLSGYCCLSPHIMIMRHNRQDSAYDAYQHTDSLASGVIMQCIAAAGTACFVLHCRAHV